MRKTKVLSNLLIVAFMGIIDFQYISGLLVGIEKLGLVLIPMLAANASVFVTILWSYSKETTT